MLYQKIACKMAEYLEREAVIEKEQKEECAYGLENANFIDLFSWNAVWCSLFFEGDR